MEFVNLDELGCAKTCFVNTVSFFESCDDLVDVEEFDYLVFFKVILNVFKEFFDSIVFNQRSFVFQDFHRKVFYCVLS